MRKKFLATLMAVSMMAIGMVGCGEENEDWRDSALSYEQSIAANIETIQPKETLQPLQGTLVPSESDKGNQTPPAGARPMEDIDANNVAMQMEGGIYIMALTETMSYHKYAIYRLDTDDATSEQISSFNLSTAKYRFAGEDLLFVGYYGHLRFSYIMFSSDFTKCAVNLLLASGETHAGWMNADGTFFDINQAFNESSKSEFDTPKHFISLGFIEDQFVYWDKDNDVKYYVDVNNPSSKQNGDPIRDKFGTLLDNVGYFRFTDWLNDGFLLGDTWEPLIVEYYGIRVNINNTEDRERFFTEDAPRQTWGFVCSPDCKSVAFFSAYDGWRDLALHKMKLDTRNPERIDITNSIESDQYGTATITLLDWR